MDEEQIVIPESVSVYDVLDQKQVGEVIYWQSLAYKKDVDGKFKQIDKNTGEFLPEN